MADISPFTPNREEKRRQAKSTEKYSENGEVVLLESGMTSPMHPQYNEARKAVQRADSAYVGSPEEISKLVSKAAQTDLQEDLVVFGDSAEKAGLAPEMDEEGSIIQEAVAASGSGEKTEKGDTWEDSPFSPGANL